MREAYDHGKAIAASGEGAELLQAANVSSAPGVVMEKSSGDPSKSVIEAIRHRQWNRPK